MMKCILIFLLLPVCYFTPSFAVDDSNIKVGSFNVRWFTPEKSENKEVIRIIAKIINRYDVMLMMEIRDDKDQTAMNRLWTQVNKTAPFGLSLSIPLGRTDFYKEQYGFFYRTSKVAVTGEYQYDDTPIGNVFERDPYSVLIAPKSSLDIKPMAFTGCHTQPKHADRELQHIPVVLKAVKSKFNTTRIVFLGDLNAGCSYMSQKQLDDLELRKDKNYIWLIGDDADTNVSSHSACPYDRIIISKEIHYSDAGVFYFDKYYNLTYYETAAVSDHYPVQAKLS